MVATTFLVRGAVRRGIVLGLLWGLWSPPVPAQQTNNAELRAVPAPGKGVVDGRLDDWDLSGEILICYDLESLLDTHSVHAAAMYDAGGLYLSFRFRDRTPMVNHVDPVQQPGSGWRSDCVQLRVWTDPDKPLGPPNGGRIAHFDCYWYSDGKRPVAFVQYNDMSKPKGRGFEGKIDDAVGQGVELAFRKDADGRGYVQEMRIAWKLLRRDGRRYRAGELLRMGIECFWGDATGFRWPEHRFADLVNPDNPQREFFWANHRAWGTLRFLDHGNLSPSPSVRQVSKIEELRRLRYGTHGPAAIHYKLPADGSVTLVIEKPDGVRVRNLISDYPRRKGKNVDYWDGCDDAGRLVSPGTYRVRGLWHGPFDALFQFCYGSPGDPPWETADGRGGWLADHVPPMDVAAGADRVYAACPMSEGGSTVVAVDARGRKLWGTGRIPGGMLARHGQYLYMLGGGDHDAPGAHAGEIRLMRLDPATGKFVNFPDGKSQHLVAEYPKDRSLSPREPEGVSVARGLYDAAWLHHEAPGLAAAGDRLYVSLFYEDRIAVIDPATGNRTGEIAISGPVGLAGGPDGRLYAVSGKQVVRIEEDGQGVPVVTSGLDAPIGLAVAPNGSIYVSDWGGAMCVKVFAPDGRFLRSVGRPGGRPLQGPYDPRGMFRPRGLTVDARGRLWVAEYDYSPKRISVWDAAEGRFLREFCGPAWYAATECAVNRLRPDQAFCMGNVLDLDWRKGRWRVAGTLWRPTRPGALLGPRGEGLFFDVVRRDGRDLLVASRSYGYFCVSELKGDGSARPLAAFGTVAAFLNEGRLPDLVVRRLWDDPAQLAWARQQAPDLFAGTPHGNAHVNPRRQLYRLERDAERRGKPMRSQFIWADANGDGLVQEDEIRFHTIEEAGGVVLRCEWRFGYTRDLTVYVTSRNRDGKGMTRVWRLPVRRWNAVGAPVYDIRDTRRVVCEKPLWFLNSVWADHEGNVLLNESPMKMYTAEGRLLWTYPNAWPGVHGSHRAPKDRRGLLIGPLKVIGSVMLDGVGELFCMNGNMGKAFLMTSDGLYVGSLFRDCRSAPDAMPDPPRRGVSINGTSAGAEWFGGEFFRNPKDGKVYIGSTQAREAVVLSEVIGLDTVARLPAQTITFSNTQYAAAEKLLAAAAGKAAEQRVMQVRPLLGVSRRGAPAENRFSWSGKNAARWQFDDRHRAEAAWTFDKDNLYICFRVADDTPMINNGKEATQLFKTGDAVVFELRTVPGSPGLPVRPGDIRLLFSVFDGNPVGVLYRYKVPGAKKTAAFASPGQKIGIDEIRVLSDAQIAVDRRVDGYSLRASVPLAALGFQPRSGQRYAGDFGIVYSDRTGRINVLRMYWSNKATGIVSDLPSEARIQPEMWGVFEIQGRP
ncbi:MAG: hypothetical protein GXP31_12670 [Kiritimatiellaeota bacterium]|nr:hypothetical protein [Kiritimatiellota bacterium]